jgi:ribonuclease Z
MSIREAIFLGTSSQVPTRLRNHNAVFLLWDELGILFDPGEGTQRQMIYAGISASRITHIAITHFHGDHCLGLAGVIQRLSLDRAQHAVEVIYPASGQVFYERLRHASIFYDGATIVPRPVPADHGDLEVARSGSTRIIGRRLEHAVECLGYRVQEDDGTTMVPELLEKHGLKGRMIGELTRKGSIEHAGKRISVADVSLPKRGQSCSIVMDTRPCDGARALAKGVDLLICESTYLKGEEAEARERYHMTAQQAATLALESGSRQLVLTHFSPRYVRGEDFVKEAAEIFANTQAAEDLMRVNVPARQPLAPQSSAT